MTLKLQNKILSLLLLTIYFTYVFRIIVPLADYALNYKFIVEELCEQKNSSENTCLGKCHLSNEIQKQTDLPNDNPIIIEFDFLKNPHTFSLILTKNNGKKEKLNLDNISSEKEIQAFFKPPVPPPKYI